MIESFQGIYPTIAPTAFVAHNATVIGNVELGEHSSIWYACVVRGDIDRIRIGSETNIQDGSILHVTGGRFPLTIGNRITMGHRVLAHGCTIGDHCLIGMGAIVLDGAVIGENSIVAAGAVVAEGMIVPPRTLVAGVPAKVKRAVTDEEIDRIAEGWQHYVELAGIYRSTR